MVSSSVAEGLSAAETLVGTFLQLLDETETPVTKQDLAKMTGRCEETVCRSLRKFVRSGWVTREHREDSYTGAHLPSHYRLTHVAPKFFDPLSLPRS